MDSEESIAAKREGLDKLNAKAQASFINIGKRRRDLKAVRIDASNLDERLADLDAEHKRVGVERERVGAERQRVGAHIQAREKELAAEELEWTKTTRAQESTLRELLSYDCQRLRLLASAREGDATSQVSTEKPTSGSSNVTNSTPRSGTAAGDKRSNDGRLAMMHLVERFTKPAVDEYGTRTISKIYFNRIKKSYPHMILSEGKVYELFCKNCFAVGPNSPSRSSDFYHGMKGIQKHIDPSKHDLGQRLVSYRDAIAISKGEQPSVPIEVITPKANLNATDSKFTSSPTAKRVSDVNTPKSKQAGDQGCHPSSGKDARIWDDEPDPDTKSSSLKRDRSSATAASGGRADDSEDDKPLAKRTATGSATAASHR